MREIRTSGSMSGDGIGSVAGWLNMIAPILDFTIAFQHRARSLAAFSLDLAKPGSQMLGVRVSGALNHESGPVLGGRPRTLQREASRTTGQLLLVM